MKRTSEEKLEYYEKKIKKLKARKDKVAQSAVQLEPDIDLNNQANQDEPPIDTVDEIEIRPDTEDVSLIIEDQDPVEILPGPPLTPEPELDSELLIALGESPTDSTEYGLSILESQAKIWPPILKKGMPKDAKEKLFIEYKVPDNCRLLQAPILNAEISAALPDKVKTRDKTIMLPQQQQLGYGITAINRAIDVLLKGEERVQAIKHLSNSCRIMSDLHYIYSQNRIKLIQPSLDKTCINVIQENERDDTLFGQKLSENIKAAKAIERQGLQIKKNIRPSNVTPSTSSTRGNWHAPPRIQSNRGGRGGVRRQPMPPAQPAAAYHRRSTQQTHYPKNVQQNKVRTSRH